LELNCGVYVKARFVDEAFGFFGVGALEANDKGNR
jgi:hypothetical protein